MSNLSETLKELFEQDKDALKDYALAQAKLVLPTTSDEEKEMYRRITRRYEEAAKSLILAKGTEADVKLLGGSEEGWLGKTLNAIINLAPVVSSILKG